MAKTISTIDGCTDTVALDSNSSTPDMSDYVAATCCMVSLLSKTVNDFVQHLIRDVRVAFAQPKQLDFSPKDVSANILSVGANLER
jgi:hypothetical protein